jgi:MATE family multidrug resistance protein
MSGILLHRGKLVVFMFFIPIVMIYTQMYTILIYLGQEERVVAKAQTYIYWYFPRLFIQGMYDSEIKWMNGFGKNWVPLMCTMSVIPFHFLWSYFFVIYLDLEIRGVGLSGAISLATAYILINIY